MVLFAFAIDHLTGDQIPIYSAVGRKEAIGPPWLCCNIEATITAAPMRTHLYMLDHKTKFVILVNRRVIDTGQL